MSKSDQKVGAISTFLLSLDAVRSSANRTFYYRGHASQEYKLVPSVYRNSGWIANESTMLKELIARCPTEFAEDLTTFQCLVKMQHYSLPTRLLDVTSNPLVALFFACSVLSESNADGEVIVLGFDQQHVKYFDSDTVSVIANLARRPRNFRVADAVDLAGFNDQESIKLLLHDICQDKPHFSPIIQRDDLGRVVCVKPRLDNPRIIRQDGAFLLFGIDGDKCSPALLADNVVVGKIKINRDKKKEIANQLETLGISKATMFPDIEQVANHVKECFRTPEIRTDLLGEKYLALWDQFLRNEQLSIRKLADNLVLSPSAVSQMVSKFNEDGVIEGVGLGRNKAWKKKENVKIIEKEAPRSNS